MIARQKNIFYKIVNTFYKIENTFYSKRTHSNHALQAPPIIAAYLIENTFYSKRTHSIVRKHIL